MNHVSFADPIVEQAAQKLGFASIATIEPVVQTGVGVFNACGIACVLMLLQEVGIAMSETVNRWSRAIDPTQDGTTPNDLVRMITQLGAVATVDGHATYPYIELIYYARLDPALQWSVYRGKSFNHWIVRTDVDTYYDPLFPLGQGGPINTTKAILDGAEINPLSRVAIVQKAQPMANVTATVNTEVRVRTEPRIHEDTWTPLALREGKTIVGEVVNGWLKYTNPDFVVYNKAGVRIDALWSILRQGGTEFISVPTEPPRPVASKFKLGVNLLLAHHEANRAYDAGIRVFQFMEGLLAAIQFKQAHPDAVVMYRRLLGEFKGIADPAWFKAEAQMGHGIVFLDPHNECDNICYGEPSQIRERGKFAVAMGLECRKHGTIFAAMSSSVGTPDFTKEPINEAMREAFGKPYNDGVFAMNMHLYSPTMQHIYGGVARNMLAPAGTVLMNTRDDSTQEFKVGRDGHIATVGPDQGGGGDDPVGGRIWYERRWQFLFERCGFNPDPALLGIYCDETGVDEGGTGGFPAHNASGQDVENWSREFVALSRMPLVVEGKSYPSPLRAAAIFQVGHPNWAGYNVSPYLAEIGRANA